MNEGGFARDVSARLSVDRGVFRRVVFFGWVYLKTVASTFNIVDNASMVFPFSTKDLTFG